MWDGDYRIEVIVDEIVTSIYKGVAGQRVTNKVATRQGVVGSIIGERNCYRIAASSGCAIKL